MHPAQPGLEPSGSTSSGLLDRVRARDQEAWRKLVRLYGPLVHFWASRCGLGDEDAADICQDVFRAVAAKIGEFRHDRPGDTFRGWLHTISLNSIRNFWRQQKKYRPAVGGTDHQLRLTETPEQEGSCEENESLLDEENRLLWERALLLVQSEFERATWQAFWLTAVEGQPVREVAASLGMSAAAVRQAKSRIRRRLRALFPNPHGPPFDSP